MVLALPGAGAIFESRPMLVLPPLGFLFTRKPKILEMLEDLRNRRERIRCPSCGWQPSKGDAWCCTPDGCGHVWNTFETRGLCPSCGRQWRETACLRCSVWSPHDDWYVKKDD